MQSFLKGTMQHHANQAIKLYIISLKEITEYDEVYFITPHEK